MNLRSAVLLVLWLCAGGQGASALDCAKAASPIEKTVCRTPDLARLDASLNTLYAGLRPQLTPRARAQLLAQQRTWLAARDRDCTTADADCLRKHYWARMDDLQALGAAAQVSDGELADATPVVVKGAWKTSAVRDSLGSGHAAEADIARSLAEADLPALGAIVHITPGNLCAVPGDCETVGWTRTTVGKLEGGNVIGPSLGIGTSAPVLLGNTGAKQSEPLTLVPKEDGAFLAIFGLCEPNARHCRNAAEVWTPLGPTRASTQGPR